MNFLLSEFIEGPVFSKIYKILDKKLKIIINNIIRKKCAKDNVEQK